QTHWRGRPARIRGDGPRGKGREPAPRNHGKTDMAAAHRRQACAGALPRGRIPFPTRPRSEGVDPRALRCNRDLALLSRIRARVAALPVAALITGRYRG